jgi:hypothetical protein
MKGLVIATVLLIAAAASAQSREGTSDASQSSGTSLRQRGRIVKFDAKTLVLSLMTASGIEQFTLTAATRMRENGRDITPADLEKLAGCRARVRYLDSPNAVTSVTVWRCGVAQSSTRTENP